MMKKYYSAFLMLSASVTAATENKPLTAMQAMNQLNDRASYCMRHNRDTLAINSPIFDALTNQQKSNVIALISNQLSIDCLANSRKKFKQALIDEGIDYKRKDYFIYLHDYPLPENLKEFKRDYAEQIDAIIKSLKLPADYGSFDTLATIEKYAPMN